MLKSLGIEDPRLKTEPLDCIWFVGEKHWQNIDLTLGQDAWIESNSHLLHGARVQTIGRGDSKKLGWGR